MLQIKVVEKYFSREMELFDMQFENSLSIFVYDISPTSYGILDLRIPYQSKIKLDTEHGVASAQS